MEHARKRREAVVLLVDINPAASKCFSLHQSEELYAQHHNALNKALNGAIRSAKHPDKVRIDAAFLRLPDTWLERNGPAFDDWTHGTGPVASNLPYSGVAASRLGAFEIYVVWKPPNGGPLKVEQLFSKLFSRCLPRADLFLKRLAARPYISGELELRESEFELTQLADVAGLHDEASLSASFADISARPQWPALENTPEALIVRRALARLVLSRAIKESSQESGKERLELAAQEHLPFASANISDDVGQELTKNADAALKHVLSTGDKMALERSIAHNRQFCSRSVAKEVDAKRADLCNIEVALRKAIHSREASAMAAALRVVGANWLPDIVPEAQQLFETVEAADDALRAAIATGEKPLIQQAAAQHIPACSPSMADIVKQLVVDLSDKALRRILATGDRAALERAFSLHSTTCTHTVAEEVEQKLKEVVKQESALLHAMTSGEALIMSRALDATDPNWSPDTVGQMQQKLGPILVADAALKSAMAADDIPTLQRASNLHLAACSPSVASSVQEKLVQLADAALRAVLAMGDKAALERSAKQHVSICTPLVAREVDHMLKVVANIEAFLLRAIHSGEASAIAGALQRADAKWLPGTVAIGRQKLESTLVADAKLKQAIVTGDKARVEQVAKECLTICSPSVANETKESVAYLSDTALKAVLATGDKQVLELVAAQHLATCSKAVASEVDGKLRQIAQSERRLHKALQSGEATKIARVLDSMDPMWSPAVVEEALQELDYILESDEALRQSTYYGEAVSISRALARWTERASPSVVKQVEKQLAEAIEAGKGLSWQDRVVRSAKDVVYSAKTLIG